LSAKKLSVPSTLSLTMMLARLGRWTKDRKIVGSNHGPVAIK